MDESSRDQLVIPLNKAKLLLLLVVGIGCSAFSAWVWVDPDVLANLSPHRAQSLAVIVGLFSIAAMIALLPKLLDRRPGLAVDQDGIVDNASPYAVGRIPWHDVTGLKVSTIEGHRYLTIMVADPSKYVARGSWWRRLLNAGNERLTGSPINISAKMLSISFLDLVSVVSVAHERYLQDP